MAIGHCKQTLCSDPTELIEPLDPEALHSMDYIDLTLNDAGDGVDVDGVDADVDADVDVGGFGDDYEDADDEDADADDEDDDDVVEDEVVADWLPTQRPALVYIWP